MFCRHYNNCLNPKESAIKAGYPAEKAEKIAEKLLLKIDVSCFIEKIKSQTKKDEFFKLIITALKRMILYRPNDTIKLLHKFENTSKEEIEKLDLFHISELKKLKDGSFEFKFIDRIKAIETLLNILEKTENKTQAANFLKALSTKPAYENDEQI